MEDKVLVKNRKATHDYFIEEEYVAGMKLIGSEVKSILSANCSIAECFVDIISGEAWLLNCHVDEYKFSRSFGSEKYNPTRKRKLLLNRAEINKLEKKAKQHGYTIVPLRIIYKTKKIKIVIGLAKGKRKVDKRNDIKERDMNRDMQRKVKNI